MNEVGDDMSMTQYRKYDNTVFVYKRKKYWQGGLFFYRRDLKEKNTKRISRIAFYDAKEKWKARVRNE